jgi:hypothetical protein
MSMATSRPCRFGRGDEGVEVLEGAQVRVDRVVTAVGGADGIGDPGSSGPAPRVLFLPLRAALPIGWIGVR